MKKKIVTIGGGNGSAKTLRALKWRKDKYDISGVVSMCDSGGANGKMRSEKKILPASDLMRAATSLSSVDYQDMREIFYKNRIQGIDQEIDGYYLGIMWYWMMQEQGFSFMQAHNAFEQVVGAIGKTYPATLEFTDLCVALSDGSTLVGEGNIDEPKGDRSARITKAWLQPEVQLYQGAKQAIAEADVIIMGPGSLYTSIIATLLTTGLKEEIEKSKASLIFISGDAYAKHGEQGPTTLSDRVAELEQYLPRKVDTIIVSNPNLTEEQKEKYKEYEWELVEDDLPHDERVVRANLQRPDSFGLSSNLLGDVLCQHIDTI